MTALKCYCVDSEGCDSEDVEIIFAKSDIEAKRRWANNHDWGGIAGISARREPQWDKHAPGPVPSLVLVGDGWWMECHGCERRIDADSLGEEMEPDEPEDGDDSPWPVMAPVEPTPGRIWCTQACHDHDMSERALKKRYEARLIAWMGRRVLRRFPSATLIDHAKMGWAHAHVTRGNNGRLTVTQVIVAFSWPTMKIGPATFRIDDERCSHKRPRKAEFCCCNGDREAFEAWAAEQTPIKATEAA